MTSSQSCRCHASREGRLTQSTSASVSAHAFQLSVSPTATASRSPAGSRCRVGVEEVPPAQFGVVGRDWIGPTQLIEHRTVQPTRVAPHRCSRDAKLRLCAAQRQRPV
jgi:hypothetical protein